MKVNVDGSALGAPRLAGYNRLFCNVRGFRHGAFTGRRESAFAFEGELLAAIVAIDKAFSLGWRNLWLETDSTYVVHIFKS